MFENLHISRSFGTHIGPYTVERKLGTGGMAEVFLARKRGPRGFEKPVAIKRILPELAREPGLVHMFCAEARLLSALTHPNIAQILDFAEEGGEVFMVLEFVDGPSCASLLHAAAANGARVSAAPALYIAREVLRALAFAHQAVSEEGDSLGVVHRDVSPSNILFGKTGVVKLIDFGITRSALGPRTTIPGELKGKLRYMAPEQVFGEEPDPRGDLFTVGIVLAELLMGRSLFSGPSDTEILIQIARGDLSRLWAADLPPDLAGLLSVALSIDPSRRFQTAREFGYAIEVAAATRGAVLEESLLEQHLACLGNAPESTVPVDSIPALPTVRARPPERSAPPWTLSRKHDPPPSQH